MKKKIIIAALLLGVVALICYAQPPPIAPLILRFLDLTDVDETTYTGEAGKYMKVNAGETALEFGTPAGAGDLLADGSVPMTANWDIGNFDITLKSLTGDGSLDFGGGVSTELVNAAAPTTNAAGEIALDTTITDHQPLWQYYDGGENMTIIAIDTAQLPALDNEIVKYDAATDKFVLEADAGGGGNDVYIEEGDVAKVDSTGADLYVDFDGTDFDVGVVGNEGNVSIVSDLDIVTTSPLTINAGANLDDVLLGADADITFAIADADDDGVTKGAATFDNTDFDAAAGVVTIVDDGHAHTTTSISGVDISADTNLAVGTGITLTDDTLTATEEDIEDFVGGMLGGTETHIAVTYQDASNDIDFVVDPDSVAGSISAGAYNNDSVNDDDINWGNLLYLTTDGAGIDEAFAAGWNGDVGPPEKDDVYDILHSYDTDDDGDIDTIDAGIAALLYETELDSFAELDTQIADKALINLADGGTFTGNIVANANLSVGNAGTTAGVLTLLEDDDDGANFASFMVPALGANTVYTLPPDDGDNTEVLQTNGAGTLTWVANAGGGATAWDDISDPDNNGATTITFDNAEVSIFTGDNDAAASFITIQNTDADHTVGNFYLLDLDYSADDGDADADFIKCQDSGGTVFSVGQDGETAMNGGITVGGSLEAATITEGLVAVPNVDEIDWVAAAEMADADHGAVQWAAGVAYVQDATIADSSYASCYVGLFQAATGNSEPFYTDAALTYDATSGTLTATEFVGGGSGLTLASTDLSDTADLLYETELDDLSELITQMSDVTAFITDDDMPAAGVDPDVDAAGEIGRDTDDHSLRGYDGSAQYLYSAKDKPKQFTITEPDQLAEAANLVVWTNNTAFTFNITEIQAAADTDDATFTIKEVDADGANATTIEAVTISTNGTNMYYTTIAVGDIDHKVIEAGHRIMYDASAFDTDYIHVALEGYFGSDVP